MDESDAVGNCYRVGKLKVPLMKIAVLVLLGFSLSLVVSAAECDSAIQISEDKSHDRTVMKNVSDQAIVAYILRGGKSNSQRGVPTRTHSGSFSGEDSLGVGESMELGGVEVASQGLSVEYVRFTDGWHCGNAPPEVRGPSGSQK